MFSTFNTLMVIVVLEAICCLYSVTLAYLSDKKFSKVLNLIMAAIWAIAAVLNVVGKHRFQMGRSRHLWHETAFFSGEICFFLRIVYSIKCCCSFFYGQPPRIL